MRADDYPAVVAIWDEVGLAYQPRGRDSERRIGEQLEKECCIYLVAFSVNQVIGSLLITHDLRKAWLNRLAVWPSWQGKGVARGLVERAEEILLSLGVRIFAVQIYEHNLNSRQFFSALGYQEHDDIIYCSKRLDREE
ncbi:MAG: GNAT family N-acetyltransferase [Methanomassiliicoccales archaeon]|nr:GNAT family N-acetyltransferase [Methanomassiliicoccales archaeon]